LSKNSSIRRLAGFSDNILSENKGFSVQPSRWPEKFTRLSQEGGQFDRK
jgi:hypothetical protein